MVELKQAITEELLLSRQADLIPEAAATVSVAIVGMGAIGSNVFEVLARTGVKNFTVYDGDDLAPENVYPGAFSMEDVGLPKTEAMPLRVARDLGIELNVTRRGWFKVEDEHEFHDVWVVCTDNMKSRQQAWEVVKSQNLSRVYIDARMGGAGYEVYKVRSTDSAWAEVFETENLVNINDDNDLPCGQKSTAFLTRMIGGIVVERVRAYLNGTIDQLPNALFVDSDMQLRATA
jgi:molybdopterin/thiamine biosynthesis adenylyltransferase